jgi:uncharacterized protein (TIGR00369 family)
MDAPAIPAGFVELPSTGFVQVNGPLYGRMERGRFTLGFRVEERHCNPWGICHGGMLMTLADMTLALGANLQERLHRFLPTVKLEGDFVAPAPRGAWLEGRCEVLRVTSNLVFAQGGISTAGMAVLRASAIMKVTEPDPAWDLHHLFP